MIYGLSNIRLGLMCTVVILVICAGIDRHKTLKIETETRDQYVIQTP